MPTTKTYPTCQRCGHDVRPGDRTAATSHTDRVWHKGPAHCSTARDRADAERGAVAPSDAPTDRQVDYALSMMDAAAPADRYTALELRRLSRVQISSVIAILQSNL